MRRPRLVQWLWCHPTVTDALLAAVVTVASLGALWGGTEHDSGARDPDVLATVLTVLSTAPIAWRRRYPIAVLAIVSVGQFTVDMLGYHGPTWVAVFIAVATVAWRTTGHTRSATIKVFAAAVALRFVLGFWLDAASVAELASATFLLTGAYLVGDNLQRRRRAQAGLAEQALRVERERELLSRQRVHDERSRIARELHDVVAHSVSLMIIQAGAARRSMTSSPEQTEATLRQIEATGRQAMDELRRVLGVLRAEENTDPLALAPQPSLTNVRELIDNDPTLPVALTEVGQRPDDVPSSVGLSLYRVVQEALTNVRKHAGTVKSVAVHIAYEPGRIVVQIADDGRGASVGANLQGHGLAGMRERMALCGGSVTAGPRPGGGWQVRATAPLQPAVPEPVEVEVSA